MPSGVWHLKKEVWVCLRLLNGVAKVGKERIILGIYQKGWKSYIFQELFAACPTVVVARVSKSIDRCSVAVVKFLECLDLVVALVVNPVRHDAHFCLYFFVEHPSEPLHVKLI